MARGKLFGNLRDYAGAHEIEGGGATVNQVLNGLCDEYPGLRDAIFDGDRLLPHVRVMIDGRDIELDQGLDTPIGADDQLAIFPPIAGGGGNDCLTQNKMAIHFYIIY